MTPERKLEILAASVDWIAHHPGSASLFVGAIVRGDEDELTGLRGTYPNLDALMREFENADTESQKVQAAPVDLAIRKEAARAEIAAMNLKALADATIAAGRDLTQEEAQRIVLDLSPRAKEIREKYAVGLTYRPEPTEAKSDADTNAG